VLKVENAECRGMSKEEIMQKIANYVTVQCGMRQMNPVSIKKVYLPGIASWFEMKLVNNQFRAASKERFVSRLLSGFERLYAKLNPASTQLKLAFGMDLALKSRNVMKTSNSFSVQGRTSGDVSSLRQRVFVAMAVGIFFMLRRSEHLVGLQRKGPSRLTRRLVVFFDAKNKRIPYAEVGVRVKAQKVALNITFSKTDHSGFGRRTYHVRQDDKLRDVCVVSILEEWIKITRDKYKATEDQPLYHIPGLPDLSLETLHKVMTDTVRSLGVEKEGIKSTSHSLRYGGATMLAAAGFPEYLIAHYGGWAENSTALKRYARPSDESLAKVSLFMAEVTMKSPSQHYIQDLILRQQQMSKKGGK